MTGLPHHPAADGAAQDSTLRLLALWHTVRKNWIPILAVLVCAILIAGLYTTRQERIFRSSAVIEIDPNPPRPLGTQVQNVVDVGAGSYWTNREYYETQLKVIQGRSLAEEVVRRLRLERDAGFLANTIKKDVKRGPLTVEATAGVLQGRLFVEPVKNSRLVQVSIEDADPKRAMRVLNELLNTYLERNLETAMDSANATASWLADQLGKLKSELEQRELELHEYKRDKQILSVSLDEQSNMLRAEMTQLNERLTTVRTQIQALQARNAELQQVIVSDPANVPASELLQNATLQAMRTRYLSARTERERLLASGKGVEHPSVRAVEADVTTAKDALLGEVRNLQEAVARDLKIAKKEAEGLSSLFKQAEQRGLDLGLLEIEYRRLERDKSNTERLYTIVMERNKDGDITRLARFNNLRIVDKPTTPRGPVRPNLSTNLAVGGVVGLLLAFGLVFARDALDRSIRSPEHLEALGVTFLGLLPTSSTTPLDPAEVSKKRRRRDRTSKNKDDQPPPELTVHTAPRSGLAEASRAVRTNIRFMSPDKPYKTLLVTSAAPSEGKTTVACCLAIAMAQAGDRVLLIDCDLRRPRIHRVFGRGNSEGVTTLLLDPEDFDASRLATSIPNLSVLSSGPQAPNPAELINSERFAVVFKSLTEHYDRIIIDSPPIAPVTDAAILSTRVDATVLVVRASVTSREIARRALRTLSDVGAPVAGAILNAVAVEGRRGYYYYYQYSYGYGEADAPAAQT